MSANYVGNRPISHGGHFEFQENKKLCFCTSGLALDERLAVQNLLFQHCVIKVYTLTQSEAIKTYTPYDITSSRPRKTKIAFFANLFGGIEKLFCALEQSLNSNSATYTSIFWNKKGG